MIVRGWLVYVMSDGSELRLGQLALAMAVPMLVLAPVGGVLADRMSRRTILWVSQLVVAAVELVCFSLLLAGRLEFWHLIVCTVIVGAAFPFSIPARNAFIANLFGARGLTDALAMTMAIVGLSRVSGPAVAGVVLARFGVEEAYGVGVLMYGLAAVTTLGAEPEAIPPKGGSGGIVESLKEGVLYLQKDRTMLFMLFFVVAPMVLSTALQPMFPSFVGEVWPVGASGLGWLGASTGLGGFVGALLLAWFGDTPRRSIHILASMVLLCVLSFLFANSPWFGVAVGMVFLLSVVSQYFFGLTNTSIHILVPDYMRGRITSFITLAFSLPMLVTIGLGALAEWIGVARAFSYTSVVVGVVSLLWYWLSPVTPTIDDRINRAQEAH